MGKVKALTFVLALIASACSGSGSSSPTSPNGLSMTGTWAGVTNDSSGSMMGAGLTASETGNASLTITQSGNTFSGTMQFAGHMGAVMNVSGALNGHSGVLTINMPMGSMMAACSASATGTFDMDDMMTQLHGTYAGNNSCTGPFDHGSLSLHR